MSALAHRKGFPYTLSIGAVAIVCAALIVSAAYGFLAMMDLRSLYLEERGQRAANFMTERLRGPDRFDPENWQRLMDETLQSGSFPWMKHIALIDAQGQTLASSGTPSEGLQHYIAPIHTRGRFQSGRFGGSGNQHSTLSPGGGLSLKIGVDPESASFISRQAYLHLLVSTITVIALVGLAYSLLRTVRSFLDLKAREETQKHLAALGTMSATLAHEIRNPLGAIKGLSQVTLERVRDDQALQELMNTVVQEAERLERLVNDLLSFARPRTFSAVPIDLVALIGEVVESLRSRADAGRIRIEKPEGLPAHSVLADPDGLRQVLYNVIINALEASPTGSTITVKVEESGNQAIVEILDSGSGFGERDPEELFEPFVTTKTRGTGLGLPVSRQVLGRLGGTISLRNRRPSGAICRITLPAIHDVPTGEPQPLRARAEG